MIIGNEIDVFPLKEFNTHCSKFPYYTAMK